MQDYNLDHELMEEELETSPPEAFYLALRNALEQMKRQPVEVPVVH
jgi:hypothetical protein